MNGIKYDIVIQYKKKKIGNKVNLVKIVDKSHTITKYPTNCNYMFIH